MLANGLDFYFFHFCFNFLEPWLYSLKKTFIESFIILCILRSMQYRCMYIQPRPNVSVLILLYCKAPRIVYSYGLGQIKYRSNDYFLISIKMRYLYLSDALVLQLKANVEKSHCRQWYTFLD